MGTDTFNKSTFELIIQLIDALIWPLTLLLILLIFRRHLAEVILRLGTFKADKTGIELSFDKKIEATKKMFQQIQPATIAKSGGDINAFPEENDSPFGRILKARSDLINRLKIICEKEGVPVNGLSPELITEKLKINGAMTLQQAKMVQAMLEVTAAADSSATEGQASEVENLMKKIEIN